MKRPFGNNSRFGGGIGGFFGFRQDVVYYTNLFVHRFVMPLQGSPLTISEVGNSNRSHSRDYSAPHNPPVARRVILLCGSALFLFPCRHFGVTLIDSGRGRIGNLLVFSGFSFFAVGLALMALSGFP